MARRDRVVVVCRLIGCLCVVARSERGTVTEQSMRVAALVAAVVLGMRLAVARVCPEGLGRFDAAVVRWQLTLAAACLLYVVVLCALAVVLDCRKRRGGCRCGLGCRFASVER